MVKGKPGTLLYSMQKDLNILLGDYSTWTADISTVIIDVSCPFTFLEQSLYYILCRSFLNLNFILKVHFVSKKIAIQATKLQNYKYPLFQRIKHLKHINQTRLKDSLRSTRWQNSERSTEWRSDRIRFPADLQCHLLATL